MQFVKHESGGFNQFFYRIVKFVQIIGQGLLVPIANSYERSQSVACILPLKNELARNDVSNISDAILFTINNAGQSSPLLSIPYVGVYFQSINCCGNTKN
jgi:hypothetical protein